MASVSLCDNFLRDLMSGGGGAASPLQYDKGIDARLEICMVCKKNKNYSIFGLCRNCDAFLYKRSLASGDEVSNYQSTL